eukprot:gene9330-12572_t
MASNGIAIESIKNRSNSRFESPNRSSINLSKTSLHFDNSPYFSSKQQSHQSNLIATSKSFKSSSSSSVISAFRELQSKCKTIEAERALAIKERDELRQQLNDRKIESKLMKDKFQQDTKEYFNHSNSINDLIKSDYHNMENRLSSQEEMQRSYQRGLVAQNTLRSTLADDVIASKTRLFQLQEKNELLLAELELINNRSERADEIRTSSPIKNRSHYTKLDTTIESLESQIHTVRNQMNVKQHKIQNISNYIDLIIKINNELCETVDARSDSREKLRQLVELYQSIPPRYQWPKSMSYSNILNIVNEAASVTANAAIELDARSTSSEVVKSILKDISPSKSKYSSQYSTSISPPRRRSYSAPRVPTYSNTLDDSDDYDDTFNGTKVRKNSKFGHSYNSNKSVSFDSQSNKSRSNNVDYSEDDNYHLYSDNSNNINKKLRKSVKSSRIASRENDKIMSEIARHSALPSTTRFAAAVNAAAQSINSSPIRIRSKSPLMKTGIHLDSDKTFIPVGNQKQEFNIVASVSKASRAAKQLNSTIASKVKSLHSGGSGDIFSIVPRVDIQDIQNYLKSKK